MVYVWGPVWEPRVPFRVDLESPRTRAAIAAMVPLVRASRSGGVFTEEEFFLCAAALRKAVFTHRVRGRAYSTGSMGVGEVERWRVTVEVCLRAAHAVVAAECSDG